MFNELPRRKQQFRLEKIKPAASFDFEDLGMLTKVVLKVDDYRSFIYINESTTPMEAREQLATDYLLKYETGTLH